jgi:hypothetical protein
MVLSAGLSEAAAKHNLVWCRVDTLCREEGVFMVSVCIPAARMNLLQIL